MELTYVIIVVLASMIFILAGMVGYLYWQQTRMLQHIQSLAMAVGAVAEQIRQPEMIEEEPVHVTKEDDEVDDRVSVKETVEIVEGPPTATSADQDDVDDLQDKTSAELKDLLTKKGIPFGKRDSKAVLIQLLKATA
jgi:hypothetical protein